MDYINSSLYKQGLVFKKLGELLLNKNSTIHDIAKLGFENKIKFTIFSEQEEKEENSEEKK